MTNEAMTKEAWDVRMDGDMVTAGLSERTREACLRAVRQLVKFHHAVDPDTLENQHVKDYLLWLRAEKRAAPGTLQIAILGTFPLSSLELDSPPGRVNALCRGCVETDAHVAWGSRTELNGRTCSDLSRLSDADSTPGTTSRLDCVIDASPHAGSGFREAWKH